MTTFAQDPAEGSRATIERELRRKSPRHPEDRKGAARATQDNDLTTGHSTPGDGGDDNSKAKQK
jgi:hypothetical protein